MLSIHDRSDVTIERVAFEGNGAVAFGAVVSSHLNPVVNIRFRECSFRSTTRALVRIGPDIPASASTAGARPIPSTRGDQLMWNIELLGCDFAGAGEDAILLRATRASGVHFGGCRFHGQANAMIAAFGGRFTLTSCMFANSRTTGCDVLLVHPFNEDGSDGLRSAPPSFTAIHCDSTSWTFLVTRTATAAQGPAFLSSAPTTVLVNVEHIAPLSYRRLSDAAAQASGQESLLWNPGFGNLILLGCSLTGMTDASAASASSIFNIASGFDRLNLPAGLGIRNAQFLSLAEYIEAANRRTQEARDDELAREAGMFPTGSIDTGSRSTVGDSGSSNAGGEGGGSAGFGGLGDLLRLHFDPTPSGSGSDSKGGE
jgi:hypothetical protein